MLFNLGRKNKDILKIRRCDFSIKYNFCNKKFNYFPDYVVFYKEEKVLTEIKSIRNYHFLKRKDKEQAKFLSGEDFVKKMILIDMITYQKSINFLKKLNLKDRLE